MAALVIGVFGLVIVAYVWASHGLARWNITAPMVFTLAGAVIGWVQADTVDTAVVHAVAELTLALVLFHDAAQVRPRQLESDAALCVRLLLVGLPLTILLGFVMARLLMPEVGTWLALLLAASLAPTDAGLGAATVLNPVVPRRIRRILNVESGLNDGMATPVVLFAIAAAGGTEAGFADSVGAAVAELVVGVLVGVVLGAGCGRLLSRAQRLAHVDSALISVGTLAVPLACYYGSVALHGNGFIGAFVGGMAFGAGFAAASARTPEERSVDAEESLYLTTWISTAQSYAVWALFGAVGVAQLPSMATWHGLIYAVLSLTVLRMAPVALALLGSRLAARTVLFIGWYGPRGLASVIFALITVEGLPATPVLETVIGTVTTTVLLSVLLHGVTADPGARSYGNWIIRTRPIEETRASIEPARGRGAAPATLAGRRAGR